MTSNTFRLIYHLSLPDSFSLKNEIDPSMCLVSYSSFHDAILKIREVGNFALLAKADIKSAFRLLPIHPSVF